MHICLMNSASGWGGGERMFLELGEGFLAAGHAVTLVCRPGSALAARAAGNVETCELRCRSDFDIGSLRAVHALLRRRRSAALLCNWGRDCVLGGLAARLRGVPAIRVKAMEDTRPNLRNRIIYGGLLSGVVSVSRAVDSGLTAVGVPPERRYVVYNGIAVRPPAIDRAAARARFDLAAGDFAAAFTGRLVPEKGVDLLPSIVAAVRAAGVPLRLLLAGDGPLRGAVEGAVAAAGLADCVAFLGFVDDPLTVLRAADAAIMPSRTEAFPVAALEALAMQVPLVACAAGGLAEIVTHERSGLLVPVGDVRALAAQLVRLYRETGVGQRLAAGGAARAAELSRERMIDRYLEIVRALSRRA
ncbi:glycosyltransferase [Candidatus Binatia bacterium]|nr:glycosyltransferase [Candidatus Binatia bacterium]